ncbi:MAG: glycosyltransferase family 39 protein [Elusimicrobia bacterium]|nr:glycosyltransferase family 39 protein [Elusimicrobiota bacterium]
MGRKVRIKIGLLMGVAAGLSLWGLGWCLPEEARIARVLPSGINTPEFRELLQTSWKSLHQKLGPDILLHPEVFSMGFEKITQVPMSWKTPPPVLLNSARSFYLRSGHEDEADILVALSRIRPHCLELNPRIYYYGGAYMYSLGAWIAALSLVTPATLRSGIGFYLEHIDKMAWLYFLGRLFSVAVYGAALWLLYQTGRRFFSQKVGLWAATLFAVCPGVVLQTHYMKPHLLGSVFVLATFYGCADLLKTGNLKAGHWAGVTAGLAGGTAIHLWSSFFILLFSAALRMGQGQSVRTEARWLLRAGLLAVAVYFLVNPYLLTEMQTSWKATQAQTTFLSVQPSKIIRFFFYGLPHSITWPLYFCLLAGLFTQKNLKDPVRLLGLLSFAGFLLTTWIYPIVDRFDSVRYFGILSVGFLLAAIRIEEWRSSWRRIVWVPILNAALLSLVIDYNLHLDATGRSTRHAAGRWIEQEIPEDSDLGFLRLPQPSNSPYFQWNRYHLTFVELRSLAQMEFPEKLPQYLVLTSSDYDDRRALGHVLREHYRKIKTFPPASWGWVRPPIGQIYGNPLVEIYQKREGDKRHEQYASAIG